MTLQLELRGQQVDIDLAVLPPEPDVGIFHYGFEDEIITDLKGNELDWKLTDEEIDQVGEAMDYYIT
jgi:hypothetical protein